MAPPAPVAGWLSSQRLSPTLLLLEWPVMGGLRLEVADALQSVNWAVLTPSVSNGLNRVTVDTSSGSFYFRLKKSGP